VGGARDEDGGGYSTTRSLDGIRYDEMDSVTLVRNTILFRPLPVRCEDKTCLLRDHARARIKRVSGEPQVGIPAE